MTDVDVQVLLRQAVKTSDAAMMREAFDHLLAGGPDALSPEAEYETRHENYLMEKPQSGERIRGREAMRSMQEKLSGSADHLGAASGGRRRNVGA